MEIISYEILRIKKNCIHLTFFLVGFKIRQHGSGMLMKIPSLVWLTMDVVLFYFSKKIAFVDNIITKVFNFGLNFALHIIGAIMAFENWNRFLQEQLGMKQGQTPPQPPHPMVM